MERLNAPWRQTSSSSSSGRAGKAASWMEFVGKKGHGDSGRLPRNVRQYKSGHRGFGAHDGTRKRRGLSQLHTEYSTRGGSNIFQLVDTAEQKDHFVASRRRWLESQRKQQSKNVGKMSGMIFKYQGVMAKAPPCPERTLQTPMPQQSSLPSRDEESQWVAVEERRRRRVAFEETARSVLRYLVVSEDLEVSVTELQEQLGMSEEAGIFIKQVAQLARNIF